MLGTFLVEQEKTLNLRTIVTVFKAIVPQHKRLIALLDDDRLNDIFHRRNLIVHRQGIIDDKFLKKCKVVGAIGSRLEVTPSSFGDNLEFTIELGTALTRILAASV